MEKLITIDNNVYYVVELLVNISIIFDMSNNLELSAYSIKLLGVFFYIKYKLYFIIL